MERLILALGTREVVLHNEGSKEPQRATASHSKRYSSLSHRTSTDPWATTEILRVNAEDLAWTLSSEAVMTAVSTAPKEGFATSFYQGFLSFFSLYNMTQATPPEATISFKHLQEIPATQLIENAIRNKGSTNFDHQLYTTAVPYLDPTGSWTGYLLVKSVGIASGLATSRYSKHHLGKEATSCETASEKLTTQDEILS